MMTIGSTLLKLKNGLIVSCQAEDDDPFNSPEGVTLFARAAEMGGAAGIRSCGLEKTNKILAAVRIPVIGITKGMYHDGRVMITRSESDVDALFEMGCSIVAIDGTLRIWEGLSGPEFIARIKARTKKPIMADISTVEDALACSEAGADCISTTLNGYTNETAFLNNGKPNFELMRELVDKIKIPLIAEGRISCAEEAKKAIDLGAFAVVVGTAITRPRLITQHYIKKMKA
jgi:N-acylglucosamine-6-phosphate 2-epimerase